MADTPHPTPGPPPISEVESTKNLDGLHLFLGISGGAARFTGEWDSTIGGHASVAMVSEGRAIELTAIDFGLSQFGEQAGGRAWVTPAVGARFAGLLVGVSGGVSAHWDRTEPPLFGGVATLWVFAAVVPTLTIGQHQRDGTFVELGLRLTLPTIRLSRRALF